MRFSIFKSKPGPTPLDQRQVEVVEFDYTPPQVDLHDMPMAHCDNLILHAPGECQYCDHYPGAQALRDWWQINFTGHHDTAKLPCPSTLRRTDAVRDLWGGNVALSYNETVSAEGPTFYWRLS